MSPDNLEHNQLVERAIQRFEEDRKERRAEGEEAIRQAETIFTADIPLFQLVHDNRRPWGCINYLPSRKYFEPSESKAEAERHLQAMKPLMERGERIKMEIIEPGATYRVGSFRVEKDGKLILDLQEYRL